MFNITVKSTLFFTILFNLILISPVQAVVFDVTRTDDPTPGPCDPNDCSLREAVLAANGNANGEDTIQLQGETYNLTRPNMNNPEDGDLDISESLIIQGISADTTTINASAGLDDRVIEVGSAVPISFKLSNVTVQNGVTAGDGGGIKISGANAHAEITDCIVQDNESGLEGGGIKFSNIGLISETLIVSGSIIRNNTSNDFGGGGINFGSTGSAIQVRNSDVSGNRALGDDDGGGIRCSTASSEVHTFENSQFHDNFASRDGGGILCGGLLVVNSLTDVMLYNNEAGRRGGGGDFGSGIPGPDNALIMKRVQVTGNKADIDAAGIFFSSTGAAEIEDSAFSQNRTGEGNSGDAGGFYFSSGTGGIFRRSTFDNNYADNEGGGLWTSSPGAIDLVNCTFSHNEALTAGGGIHSNTAGLDFIGNNTIYQNTAGTMGGGIHNDAGFEPEIANSILFGNMAPTGPDCSGLGIMSLGYNLFGSTADCNLTTMGTDTTGQDPLLADLADNGGPLAMNVGIPPTNFGPPFTHRLLDNSPALDGGDPNGCEDEDGALLTTDERGQNRPDNGCDIGAYERGILSLVIDKVGDADPVSVGDTLVYTITFGNDGPDIAFNPTLTDTLPAGLTFVSVSTTDGTCDNQAGTITCLLDQLISGGTVTVTLVVTVDLSAVPSVTNIAQLIAVDANQVGGEVITTVNVLDSGGCGCRLDSQVKPNQYLAAGLFFLLILLGLALQRWKIRPQSPRR